MIVLFVPSKLKDPLERQLVADFLKRFKSLMLGKRFSFTDRKGLVEDLSLAWTRPRTGEADHSRAQSEQLLFWSRPRNEE